jgi:hypothetical protein
LIAILNKWAVIFVCCRSDLQKAVGGVPRIPVQVQCDEGSLRRHNPPRMKPDAI